MGSFDGAMAQQAAIRGAAGLGGLHGGLQGIGQAAGSFYRDNPFEKNLRESYQETPKIKTFRDELQEETDNWIKDI